MENNEKYLEEINKIKEFILNFKEEECIYKFFEYLDSQYFFLDSENKTEGMFTYQLRSNIEDLYKKLLQEELKDLSREEILEEAINLQVYGFYALVDVEFDEVAEHSFWRIEDYKALPLIKDFMIKNLESLVNSAKKDKINDLESKIEEYKNSIEKAQKSIEECLIEIGKLKK